MIQLLLQFSRNYVLMAYARDPKTHRVHMAPSKVFAARIPMIDQFRFCLGQYQEFMDFLDRSGINIEVCNIVTKPTSPGLDVNITLKEGIVLREQQGEIKEFLLSDERSLLVGLKTGGGKAQPLTAAIKVPGGWSTMGDMQIGTLITAQDGTATEVTAIYPQGLRPVYKVTLADGTATECDEDHLWDVRIGLSTRSITTKHLVKLLAHNPNRKDLLIPTIIPEDCPDIELPLYPYIQGLILQVGSNIRNFNRALSAMNRLGGKWYDNSYILLRHKQVDIYLKASIRQRMDLLSGILGVGFYHEPKVYRVRKRIYTHLVEIIRSLGYVCTPIKGSGFLRSYCTIHVNPKPKVGKLYNKIVNTEFIGYKEVQCISIAHPKHLYVTDDFIVTHNTLTSLATIADIKKRTLIVILPTFIEQWCSDIAKNLNVSRKDIMTVEGTPQLKGIIDLSINNQLKASFIIVSITTLQNFYKAFEDSGDCVEHNGYGCQPDELCSVLKVGAVIIDEVHMHLYSVYKLITYTNVPKVIALSATFITEDPLIRRIQGLLFPHEVRFKDTIIDAYRGVYAIAYQIGRDYLKHIKTTEFKQKNYSHIAFERSVIKRQDILKRYLEVIDSVVRMAYINNYQSKDKLIVFAASINMCTIITDYLTQRYKHLEVSRFVEKDPYSNLMESDIVVSTIGSAGTGKDIPNLNAVIMTTSVASPVANLQTLGRLRKLADRDVSFYYLYSDAIPKHVDYHKRKMDLFGPEAQVKFVKEFSSAVNI